MDSDHPPEDYKELRFEELHSRHKGVSEALAHAFAEGARVCLDRHHSPPVLFSIYDGDAQHEVRLVWEPETQVVSDAWSDQNDTVEDGACACALAALESTRGLFAVRRANRGSAADYYVSLPGASEEDIQETLRFEISGTDAGGWREIRQRAAQKLQRMRLRSASWPGMAAVVGFRQQVILIADMEIEEADEQ